MVGTRRSESHHDHPAGHATALSARRCGRAPGRRAHALARVPGPVPRVYDDVGLLLHRRDELVELGWIAEVERVDVGPEGDEGLTEALRCVLEIPKRGTSVVRA